MSEKKKRSPDPLTGLSVEGRNFARRSVARSCDLIREALRGDIKVLKGIGHDSSSLDALLEADDVTLLRVALGLLEEAP